MSKGILKSSEMLNMSNIDLKAELANRKKELLSLRFKMKLGELSDVSLFKKAKKVIARINTELNKRKKLGVQ